MGKKPGVTNCVVISSGSPAPVRFRRSVANATSDSNDALWSFQLM
jgi:hypothetical protein